MFWLLLRVGSTVLIPVRESLSPGVCIEGRHCALAHHDFNFLFWSTSDVLKLQ